MAAATEARPSAAGAGTNPPAVEEETLVIIGGSGAQGRGLALRFAAAGLRVVLGSREALRGREAAAALNARLQARGQPFTAIAGGENQAVCAQASQLWLAAPFAQAAELLRSLAPQLAAEALVVDVTVPLRFAGGRVELLPTAEGSGALHLKAQALPPERILCGAAKTLPAHLLDELETPLECDTFVFGEAPAATARVRAVLARIPGLRPLDAGDLRAAATIEGMTALLIRLNRAHKSRHGRYQLRGL